MTEEPQPAKAVEVFYSYAHTPEDEKLKDELLKQLAGIERQGVIVSWHDRKITAGREWAGEIDERINTAGVILLLVSPDFMASGYCNDVELKRGMERHEAGEARVIPVVMRPSYWKGAPFEKLQMLPTDARPVTLWANRDEALLKVAEGIHKAVEELAAQPGRREGKQPSLTNIPRPPVVGFVARRDEQGRDIVERLIEELAPEKRQLVSLWGPGGAGKTTLAAEVVRATEAVFRGRVAWASSLRRADFGLATLLDEIATQLGREDLRKLAPEPKAAEVAALVGAQPTLVVLDNFETIAEEEQARCLDFLAQGAACPALITTRSFINRDDVYNVPLAAMTMEEARDFLQRLIKRTRKPSNFSALDHDDLIRRCEANPLVLQWVVRQIDLAHRTEDVLDDLAQGEGDAAQRIFDRSLKLPQVGQDGRDTLLALSLFTPHASRESLAEVAGFGQDLRRLGKAVESLSALWLVETTEGNERLFLRGLTRELAKSRLSKDSRADEFRSRFSAYFLRYAEAHKQPTPEDYDVLEAEKDNLLSATDMAFALKTWQSVMLVAYALATPVSGMLSVRGYWVEALRVNDLGLKAARNAQAEEQIAALGHNAAIMYQLRGEQGEASQLYGESLEIKKRLGDQSGIARTLHQLAVLAHNQGDLDEARRLYGESLDLRKRLGDQLGIALTNWGLGNIALDQGDNDEAKRLIQGSLKTFRELKDEGNTASTISQLGVVHYYLGEFAESKAKHEESLVIRRKIGDLGGIAIDLHQLAMLAHERGELEQARRLYGESLKIKKRLGNQQGIAITSRNLGLIAEKEGDKKEAVRLFREALHISEKLGSPVAEKLRRDLDRVEARSD